MKIYVYSLSGRCWSPCAWNIKHQNLENREGGGINYYLSRCEAAEPREQRGGGGTNLILFITRESEIAELEALVPDIREKIQDTKDMKQQNLKNREEELTWFCSLLGSLRLLSWRPLCRISGRRSRTPRR
jgi:hypothetical protein